MRHGHHMHPCERCGLETECDGAPNSPRRRSSYGTRANASGLS